MKVLIIEDEIPAGERLKGLIQEFNSSFELVGPLESNEEVINWFQANEQPGLIFSDIELLDGPVFYAFDKIRPKAPIIFTTAYDQYALDAFKTNGISYLMKPFDKEELLIRGPLQDTATQIVECRAEARARHGWIMDTYLLRRTTDILA